MSCRICNCPHHVWHLSWSVLEVTANRSSFSEKKSVLYVSGCDERKISKAHLQNHMKLDTTHNIRIIASSQCPERADNDCSVTNHKYRPWDCCLCIAAFTSMSPFLLCFMLSSAATMASRCARCTCAIMSFPPSSAKGPVSLVVGVSWGTPTEAGEVSVAKRGLDAGEGEAPEPDVGVAGPPWE